MLAKILASKYIPRDPRLIDSLSHGTIILLSIILLFCVSSVYPCGLRYSAMFHKKTMISMQVELSLVILISGVKIVGHLCEYLTKPPKKYMFPALHRRILMDIEFAVFLAFLISISIWRSTNVSTISNTDFSQVNFISTIDFTQLSTCNLSCFDLINPTYPLMSCYVQAHLYASGEVISKLYIFLLIGMCFAISVYTDQDYRKFFKLELLSNQNDVNDKVHLEASNLAKKEENQHAYNQFESPQVHGDSIDAKMETIETKQAKLEQNEIESSNKVSRAELVDLKMNEQISTQKELENGKKKILVCNSDLNSSNQSKIVS